MLINEAKLLEHFENDKSLIHELSVIFDSSYPVSLTGLKKAVSQMNYEGIELHAHTLKGMVANFFAEEAIQTALNLELIGREKKEQSMHDLVHKLEKDLPQIVDELKRI